MATKNSLRATLAGAMTAGLMAGALAVPASADVPLRCDHTVAETGTTVTACTDADVDVTTRSGYAGGAVSADASADAGVRDEYGGEIITKPGVRDPLALGEAGASRSAGLSRTGADVNETSLGSEPTTFFYILGQPVQMYKYFLPEDDVSVYTAGYTTSCDVGRTGPADSLAPGGAQCSTELPLEELFDAGTAKSAGWSLSRIFR